MNDRERWQERIGISMLMARQDDDDLTQGQFLSRDLIVLDLFIQPLHHMWDMTQGQFLSRDVFVLALFIQPLHHNIST